MPWLPDTSKLSSRERRLISVGRVPVNVMEEILRCRSLTNDVKLGKLPENIFAAKSIVVNVVGLTKLVGKRPLHSFPRISKFSA